MELGQRALDREDVGTARCHFMEAADLNPTDELPRTILEELEPSAPLRGFGRLRAWISRA
jgi:hypothetical protein